jgi:hypothetical protein
MQKGKKIISASRIELETFRLQSNITVERDTVQVRTVHDLKVFERIFELTTNYTKRRDATVETVLGILLDLMLKWQIQVVYILRKKLYRRCYFGSITAKGADFRLFFCAPLFRTKNRDLVQEAVYIQHPR